MAHKIGKNMCIWKGSKSQSAHFIVGPPVYYQIILYIFQTLVELKES